jgi:hypothetical protein
MTLGDDAAAVLAANWTGRYTVPSRLLYPHQWSWDSAFTSVGLRHVAPDRARLELRSLIAAQWADGRLPHIAFDPSVPADAYFPGPAFWQSSQVDGTPIVETTGLIQPPVHAWAAWLTHEADPSVDFLRTVYQPLVDWHRYLSGRRDLGGDGLVALVHPWESGMDNSPAWDEPLSRVTPVPGVGRQRRDLTHGNAAERPTDEDYGRYIRLAGDYRDAGYREDGSAFAVEDPLANAVLARSEVALASIASAIGLDPAPHLARAAKICAALVNRLYDERAGIFFTRDLVTDRPVRRYVISGLTPLVIPDLPVAGSIVKTLLGERFRLADTVLPPTYDLTADGFEPARYWRGPGWFNISWLILHGLLQHGELERGERLRSRLIGAARSAGFREYVDPLTGAGHGATDFSWTAAVVLDLLP